MKKAHILLSLLLVLALSLSMVLLVSAEDGEADYEVILDLLPPAGTALTPNQGNATVVADDDGLTITVGSEVGWEVRYELDDAETVTLTEYTVLRIAFELSNENQEDIDNTVGNAAEYARANFNVGFVDGEENGEPVIRATNAVGAPAVTGFVSHVLGFLADNGNPWDALQTDQAVEVRLIDYLLAIRTAGGEAPFEDIVIGDTIDVARVNFMFGGPVGSTIQFTQFDIIETEEALPPASIPGGGGGGGTGGGTGGGGTGGGTGGGDTTTSAAPTGGGGTNSPAASRAPTPGTRPNPGTSDMAPLFAIAALGLASATVVVISKKKSS